MPAPKGKKRPSKTSEAMTSGYEDPYTELANAIIIRAVNDYKILQKRERVGYLTDEEKWEKKKIERFFEGEWFTAISNADGKIILEALRKKGDRLVAHKNGIGYYSSDAD